MRVLSCVSFAVSVLLIILNAADGIMRDVKLRRQTEKELIASNDSGVFVFDILFLIIAAFTSFIALFESIDSGLPGIILTGVSLLFAALNLLFFDKISKLLYFNDRGFSLDSPDGKFISYTDCDITYTYDNGNGRGKVRGCTVRIQTNGGHYKCTVGDDDIDKMFGFFGRGKEMIKLRGKIQAENKIEKSNSYSVLAAIAVSLVFLSLLNIIIYLSRRSVVNPGADPSVPLSDRGDLAFPYGHL